MNPGMPRRLAREEAGMKKGRTKATGRSKGKGRASGAGRKAGRAGSSPDAYGYDGVKSAHQLRDEVVESALLSGEHAGILRDYFGEHSYGELRELAQEAASRSVRGGPRVLIVPGIMGSKIGRERKGFLDDLIWIDPVDVAAGNLMDLGLNGGHRSLKPLGVILLAYLKLKLRLRRAGYDADFHPYDWRQGLSFLGQDLSRRLSKEKAKTVHIVAHSMGGLVTRAAVPHNKKIGRVVMLGTPNYGSFVPVQALRAVYPIIRKLAFVDLKHSADELVSHVFNSFPGLYQMLPWQEKFSQLDLYDPKTWPRGGPRPQARLLRAAGVGQDCLCQADERFFLIAGVNQDTVVEVRKEADGFVYDYSVEGDGTVPLVLAELPGAKTYYIEESHGSLPNNWRVAEAVDDILASGQTSTLPDEWKPSRAGFSRTLRDSDLKDVVYDGPAGRALSLHEQRYLLEELVSPTSRDDGSAISGPMMSASGVTTGGYGHEFDRIVIGRSRQHRLEIRLAFGSITDVDSGAYVLGMFRDVTPAGPARSLNALLDGTVDEFISRRMFTGNVGEVSIIPTGRHPIRADVVAFAGMGPFDTFNDEVLELIAENVLRTFLKTKVEDFATVLFGGASGRASATSLEHLLKGFLRGLRDADMDYRFRGVTICENNKERYNAMKGELFRLSSTPLFDDIEVTIDEIQLPPPVEWRIPGLRGPGQRQPVYLIVRSEKSPDSGKELIFHTSLLTAGTKAAVLKSRQKVSSAILRKHLDKIEGRQFTFSKLEAFGRRLGRLILSRDITKILQQFREHHMVVVHDAPSSLVPWEILNVDDYFPAATGGVSRRYVAENLSVAKWLKQRQHGPTLDVLLVVNPTEDLDGAEEEGNRIHGLFSDSSLPIRLHAVRGPEARKKALMSLFSSGKYDVVHYAGHAFFDPDHPARSGILCHRGEVLSGAELAGIGNLPALMFFNACEAGRVRRSEQRADPELDMTRRIQRNVGLAEAFLRGGVANYVGTYWPVGDASAKRFAEVFYADLLRGETIGAALLAARKAVKDARSVDWADYVLYGNQEFVLKIKPE
jgi:pimeloyl-ACP methyl ester carboxylesterase